MEQRGEIGAIYFNGIQVGAFGSPDKKHPWILDEITALISSLPGTNNLKVEKWKARCDRYILWLDKVRKAGLRPARICGETFDFVFCDQGMAIKCKGQVVTDGLTVGSAVNEWIKMEGKPPIIHEPIRRD